jgi:uncharacterized membrane protein
MKFFILMFIAWTLLMGHVVYGLHKAKVEGHIDEASRIIVRGLR